MTVAEPLDYCLFSPYGLVSSFVDPENQLLCGLYTQMAVSIKAFQTIRPVQPFRLAGHWGFLARPLAFVQAADKSIGTPTIRCDTMLLYKIL